jgi:acyl-CoA synthetase (NDP forming)
VDAAILSAVPVTPSLDTLPADPQGRHTEDLTGAGSLARRLIDIVRGSPKPAVVVVDSGGIYDPMCRLILEAGIPVFRKIDRAVRALAAFCAGEGVQA